MRKGYKETQNVRFQRLLYNNFTTSPEVNTFLYSLIEHRHGKGSMIFIANEAFTQFYDLFGGPKEQEKQ